MASRPILSPFPTIINGDMATTLTSDVTVIQNLSGISFGYSWTGSSLNGIVVVEVSDDYTQNQDGTVRNPGTWNQCPLSAPTLVIGGNGNGFIDMAGIMAYAIRTRYIPTSGTGILNAIITAKVF